MQPNIKETEEMFTPEVKKPPYKTELVWKNIFLLTVFHLCAFYGLYLIYAEIMWQTFVFGIGLGTLSGLAVTAGLHRLWTHRTYKAKWPLRLFYSILTFVSGQNDIYTWARDHRVHHKFSDTDGDPHNSTRGFFFSHMGWLMCRKHPDVTLKGKTVDMSDLLSDPIVRWNRKVFVPMFYLFGLLLPTIIPYYSWNESLWVAFFTAGTFRYILSLHSTWLVNSAAHAFGYKPYDKKSGSTESLFVIFFSLGEGFHNYHHSFPWDYRVSEFGWLFNITTVFIDCMAKLGLAYDLKVASPELIDKQRYSNGDNSHPWYLFAAHS